MKLLDILKKYDRCVLRESAKLTKIYKTLLRESEAVDGELDEEVCPDCGEDPCVCESDAETDEAEEMISAEEFFGEADADAKTDESDTDAETDESDAETDESEDMISAKEFFSEAKADADAETDEAEDMISAEEFFAENDADAETDESDANAETDESEDDKEKKLEESLKSYRRANHRLFHD